MLFFKLKRRNHQVWIGKNKDLEVDFVVRNKQGFTQYIQVAQTVNNPATLERELKSLAGITDHHEKILLTMDYETGSYNGIKKLNAIDWLLGVEAY